MHKLPPPFLGLMLACLCASQPRSAADAATIHASSQGSAFLSLQDAIDAASAGDTVLVACGVYLEHDVVLTSGITVRSQTGHAECVTIDAGAAGRVMVLDDAGAALTRLEGITLLGGRSAGTGAGLYCGPACTLSVRDCVFQANETTGRASGGGASCAPGSVIGFSGCRFDGNRAGLHGGGLNCDASSAVQVADCRFDGNAAVNLGGGLRAAGTSPSVLRCTFTNNRALTGGGALLQLGTPIVRECVFAGNVALDSGGGLADGRLEAAARIASCTFRENEATYGGGVSSNHSTCTYVDCVIEGNTADFGGGMYVTDQSAITVLRCRFAQNEAIGGGGMEAGLSALALRDCAFRGNSAYSGGGFQTAWRPSPQLTGCTFTENQATYGGGVAALYTAIPTLTECTLYANGASADGGGIFAEVRYTAVQIHRTVIAYGASGGAVAVYGEATVALSCTDLYANAGGDWVGPIAAQAGTAGNFSADPQFCDPREASLSVAATSPCLPGNHPAGTDCGTIGAWSLGCAVVPTLVSSFIAARVEHGVLVQWTLGTAMPGRLIRVLREGHGDPAQEVVVIGPTDGRTFDFFDRDPPATSLVYWLEVQQGESSERIGPVAVPAMKPDAQDAAFRLESPALAAPPVRFQYSVPHSTQVDLIVYDVRGRQVASLLAGPVASGAHEAEWDGRDGSGVHVASGVYGLRLVAENRATARRLVLVR